MAGVAIIIPARWGSTRFPGKPLALLSGRPLIQHVWERASRAGCAGRVIIATDDMRIAETAFNFGAEVALTSPKHPSGTDRVAEVAAGLPGYSLVVNVQGDEPRIAPKVIDRLAAALREDRRLGIATAAHPLVDAADLANPNVVKVVTDLRGQALYFSRSAIPHDRDGTGRVRYLRHQGLYAYRRQALLDFVRWKPTPLEQAEKLEQLRALEHGLRIGVITVREASAGVDTPQDLATLQAQAPRQSRGRNTAKL